MIVSDAKTPDDFRREILEEIERRAAPLAKQGTTASTQRARYACGHAARELRHLAAFLESIHFGPTTVSGAMRQAADQ